MDVVNLGKLIQCVEWPGRAGPKIGGPARTVKRMPVISMFYGIIVWPHEQDICPDTLYRDSKKVPVPASAESGYAPGSPVR